MINSLSKVNKFQLAFGMCQQLIKSYFLDKIYLDSGLTILYSLNNIYGSDTL